MIRIYRNNEEGTAIVEHVEMTRAELDAALSVARETAYREAADDAHAHAEEHQKRPRTRNALVAHAERCLNEADGEARKRGEA